MNVSSKLLSFISAVLLLISQFALAGSNVNIKSINGVTSYPENYSGTPHRSAESDPFISPSNSALILIDYQPHILMGVKNINHEDLMNNTVALIKSAAHFDIPIIFSHVGVGYNGSKPFLKELTKWAPNAKIIDRTNVNAWEEPEFVAAVEATGRKKLIMGGLWTDVCLAYPAIEAAKMGLKYSCRKILWEVLQLSLIHI